MAMVSNRCREASRSVDSAISRKRAASERRNCGVIQNCSRITIRPYDAGNLSLPPGQALGFPAGGNAAMAVGIDIALEPVANIVGVEETCRLRRLRCRKAALAAAADEINVVIRRKASLPQLLGERGVAHHRR